MRLTETGISQSDRSFRRFGLVVIYSAISIVLSLALFVMVLSLADTFVKSYPLSYRFYGSASVFIAGIALLVASLALPASFARHYPRSVKMDLHQGSTRLLTARFATAGTIQGLLLVLAAGVRLLIFLPIIRAVDGVTLPELLRMLWTTADYLAAIGGSATALSLFAVRVLVRRMPN